MMHCWGGCQEALKSCDIQALISLIRSASLTVLTDEEKELSHLDATSIAPCNQVRVVDLMKAQKEDPHIARVLKLVKANNKPSVSEKYKESPLVRKLLNEWHKLHVNRKSGLLIVTSRLFFH